MALFFFKCVLSYINKTQFRSTAISELLLQIPLEVHQSHLQINHAPHSKPLNSHFRPTRKLSWLVLHFKSSYQYRKRILTAQIVRWSGSLAVSISKCFNLAILVEFGSGHNPGLIRLPPDRNDLFLRFICHLHLSRLFSLYTHIQTPLVDRSYPVEGIGVLHVCDLVNVINELFADWKIDPASTPHQPGQLVVS